MNESLSVILPVCNVQATLAGHVADILEVLPEVTAQFELLIVDDGSRDFTEEVALELARTYPQVHVVRHTRPRGTAAAVETGLSRTRGEIVLVHDGEAPLRASTIREVCRTRDMPLPETDTAEGGLAAREPAWLQSLVAWGAGLPGVAGERSSGTFRVAHPSDRAGRKLPAPCHPAGKPPNFLARLKRFALGE